MIQTFSHFLKARIEFGAGAIKELPKILETLGSKKALVVTDAQLDKIGLVNGIYSLLKEANIPYTVFKDVEQNPHVTTVDKAAEQCTNEKADVIIAVGGGSAMDVGKGAAIVVANGGSIYDYLLLRGDKMKNPTVKPVPVIAVPTTSGTGSEVSDCIVITDKDQVKDLMLTEEVCPNYALVDPELTYELPARITANTGLDVLGHALEAFTSVLDNSIGELLGKEAIRLVFQYLPEAVNQSTHESRDAMSLASMYAGIAQSKCGCTLPHALSCPLSTLHGIPHGLGVGVSQIPTIEYTKDVIPDKYKEIMNYIDPNGANIPTEKAADALIEKIHKLFSDIGVDEKVDLGKVTDAEILNFSENAMKEIDIEGSPKPVTVKDMVDLFHQILKL